MADNYYEFKNRFQLIDVDGVLLTNPGDALLTREPDNMRETRISIERTKSHGVDFEFSDKESPFGFSRAMLVEGELFNPFDFLNQMFLLKGVDAKVQLQFLNQNPTTLDFDLQYEGNLDFGPDSFSLIDYQIRLLSRRINLDDLFRTRIDTPVSLEATTSIDGSAITGLTAQSMFLHSKIIQENQLAYSLREFDFIDFTENDNWFLQLDYNTKERVGFVPVEPDIEEFNDQLSVNYGQGVFTTLTDLSVENLTPHYFFQNVTGRLFVDYDADYRLVVTSFASDTIEYLGTFINIDGVESIINSGQTFNVTASQQSLGISFSYTGSFGISEGSRFYIYDKWTIPTSSSVTQSHRVLLNKDHLMAIRFDGNVPNSLSEVYSPFGVFNHILEVINNRTSVLTSSFWTSVGNEMYNTNGYLIRGFDKADKPPIINYKDHFEKWATPSFGLGFSVIEVSGVFKVLMERYSTFYQDSEIIYVDTIYNDSWELSVDKDVVFNQIKIGYKDFPKSTDENKGDNIDEFNTVHELLTPIERVKNKVSYISNVTTSGYKIENQRREQFAKKPKDTVSDDEKIFAIKGVTSDTYNVTRASDDPVNLIFTISGSSIQMFGIYFDVRVGDIVTIALALGSSVNEGAYTVNSVTLSAGYTVVTVDETISSNESILASWILTLPTARLRASRNEEFETLDNVISPNTVYNVGLNPKYMLMNQGGIINSGFNPKPETDTVIVQDVKLNGEMTCKFKAGEGGYVLGADSQLVKMNEPIALSNINGYAKLFSGHILKFTANLSYSDVLTIRAAYLNNSPGKNYGYLRVKDPFGVDHTGFLESMVYNPLKQDVEFVLKKRFVAEGSALDGVLDFSVVGDEEIIIDECWDISTAVFLQVELLSTQDNNPYDIFFKPDGLKMYFVGNSNGGDVYEYDLSTPWDVSTLSFVQSLDVSGEESFPFSIFFKPDGLKMYIVGTINNSVEEYDLSTPWDISTAVNLQGKSTGDSDTWGVFFRNDGLKMYTMGNQFNKVSEFDLSASWDVSTASLLQTFTVTSQDAQPRSIFFKSDGLKMYFTGGSNDKIYEYNLSVAWDISTAVFLQDVLTTPQESFPQGLFFKPDGLKMYFTGLTNRGVYEYDLTCNVTEGWNLSTAVFNQSFSVDAQDSATAGLFFSPSGLKMFTVGNINNKVYEYDLSVSFDISTAVFNQDFSVNTQDGFPIGLFFKSDGLKMYVTGANNDKVYEYDLSVSFDISTAVFNQDFSVSAQDGVPSDVFFKSDGLKMYVTGGLNLIIIEYDLSVSFDISTAVFNQDFSVSAQDGNIRGLFFQPDGLKMYVTGFNNDKVYEYDLSVSFDISTAVFNQDFSVSAQTGLSTGLFFKSDGLKMYVTGSDFANFVYEYDLTN